MSNEFIVKNGLIVGGNVVTSGTITINGALAATQSWVTSQAYLTSASLSGYATQSYVTSAIAALVDAAPAALDTLNELAAALGDDASFSTTITNSIANKVAKSGDTMTGSLTFASTADNVRIQKNSSFLNLRDPYNNIHLYNAGDGTYIDANVHHWRSQGASYWMTLNGTGLGIGTTSPNKQLTFAQANDDAIQIRRLTTSQGNTSLGTGISWTWTSAGTDNETWAAIRVIMPGNSNSIMTFSTTPDSGAAGLTERMRITDTGNVGIGTSTPSQKFVVSNGSSEVFKVYGGGEVVAGTNYIYAAYSSGTSFYAQGPASFRNGIHNDTNTYLKIDGGTSGFTYFSGNVGIGTTSPGAKIHLVPTGTQIGVIVDGTSVTADTANKVLDVLYNGGSSAFSVRSNGIVYIGYDYLYVEGAGITRRYYDSRIQFGSADLSSSTTGANVEVYGGLKVFKNVSNSSTSEIFRITNGGNVGIGTTSPESKLHVAGGPITLKGGSSTDQQIVFNYAREYVQGIYNGSGHFRLQDNSLGGTVYQWDGSTFAFPNGNVGIGTSTIYAKLSISSGNYNGIRIDTNGGGYSALNIGGTGALTVDAPGITGGRFQITDSGNVGIGTPSPATKLHIVSTSTTELRLENSDANNNHGFIKYETQNSSGGNLIIGTNASGGGYGALLFTANNNVDFVGGGDLRIVKSGNVGIGTYSPFGKLTVAAGASYGITASSSQRYLMQALNTSNNVNSSYGWWWFHDNNSNMGFHADGIGDILTLTRGGTAIMLGGHTMWHAGNDGSGSGLDADTLDGLHASSFLLSNFGNVEGEHSYGYPSSEGWYKIAEVVLNGTCQSYNLWGEYRDTGYFDNSHYRIHITARAECDFPSNNESHAINVNIYGSSTNETYFTNNVRVILTSSSSNYRKYELQYYRATWDTGSWRLQTLGWTTYATSQTAGTSTGTPRVYYISKFVADNIYAANKISIGTSYSGFAANIAGTTYIIGGSVWTQNGYGFTNSGSNNTGMFPDSNHVITFKNNNSDNVTINASGNVGIGTSSPAQKLHVEGIARLGGSTTDGALYVYSSNGTLNSLISGPGNTYLNATYGNVGVGVNPTSGDKFEVAGSVRIHTGNNWDGIQIYAGGADGYIRGIGDETGLHIRSEYGNVLLADDRGKVGIGFTTPQKKLDVYGTGIVASFGGGIGAGDFAGIHFGYSESNLNNDIYKKSALVFERTDNHNQGGNASGKIHFLLNNAVSTSANSLTHSVVTIDSDANGTVGSVRMGIGTTSPSTKLEVGNFLDAVTNKITVAARYEYEPEFNFRLGQSGTNYDWIGAVISSGDDGNYNGKISFKTANANRDTPTTKMVIKASGNVGIGTTSPSAKLHINAATGDGLKIITADVATIKMGSTTGGTSYWGFATTNLAASDFGIYQSNAVGGDPITAGTPRLYFKSDGNIGIGTTSPTEKLHVNGDTRIVGNTYVGGIINAYQGDASIWVPNLGQAFTVKQTTGNVGIGTTSPNDKLSVNGNIGVEYAGYFGFYRYPAATHTFSTDGITSAMFGIAAGVFSGRSDAGLTVSGYDQLRFYTENSERIRINRAGKVSIGTTDTNSDKSDFTVYTGSGASIALVDDQVRMGGADVNWGVALRSYGALQTYGQVLYLTTQAGNYSVTVQPNGVTSAQFYQSETYINTYTKINYNWGGGDHGAEAFTIQGTYPSITLRSTNADFKWLLHTDASGNFRWYTGSTYNNNAWTNRFTFGIDNNFYVDSGHIYAATGNSTQWNTAYSWGNHASAGYATTSYVTTQINNLINGAPGALDTLSELASALGNDSSFATTVTNSIAGKVSKSGDTMTGDLIIGTASGSAFSQPFGDFAQLKFDNSHSDTNRGPNKIVMHDNGGTWIGGFGIHSDTVSYYTGGHHRWYKTTSQTSSDQVMQLDPSGNLSITGTFSASGYNSSNWNTAYGWGNHASAGYASASSLANYLPLAGGTMSGSINMNGNNVINIGQVNATHAIFTNDGSSRVMYIRGSGNIIQFQDASANNKWELVGRDGEFYIYKNDGTGAGYKWRIDGVGNHAITGAVSISSNLNVAGELAFLDGASSYSNIIRAAAYPSEGYPAGQNYWMEYRAKGGHHFVLNTDGGVGSGANSMDDFVIWQGAIDGNRLLEVSNIGNLWIAGALTEASSLKLKENVETSEGNLEKVVNLRPVTYNKIGSQTTELGLIAEEVAEVYPEFVQYDENGDPIGVNYSRLTAALIGAVKELTNQVQELNKKING